MTTKAYINIYDKLILLTNVRKTFLCWNANCFVFSFDLKSSFTTLIILSIIILNLQVFKQFPFFFWPTRQTAKQRFPEGGSRIVIETSNTANLYTWFSSSFKSKRKAIRTFKDHLQLYQWSFTYVLDNFRAWKCPECNTT